MKVGVFTVILASKPLEEALDYLAELGVQAVEIGAGGYPGTAHCPVDDLLASDRKAKDFLAAIKSRGLQISSLSCHGNPVHPDKKRAQQYDADFQKAVRLAAKLGVTKPVITRALDTMGKLGLVSRRRDETDRRNVIIQRTVKGALAVEKLADVLVTRAKELPR